ncbi:iron chelate uptake ABC transporter family permease subunit [Nonomuraea endophytica]|uniref:iron chelate uptake ABC transporter family permease subunit n=1 Tax=Nonomuraea endophytica TaxID=714136 RepID=UPI0037CACDF1
MSTTATPQAAPADDRCVAAKDYFPVKQTLKHATNPGVREIIWTVRLPRAITAALAGAALAGVKPLNALLLGEDYARTMGVQVRVVRTLTLLTASALAGAVTAYCGLIAFLGLAVPHVCGLLLGMADHRLLMLGVIMLGAVTALLCCVAAQAPGGGVVLPLNAVTTIVGAPVVITVLLRSQVARTGLVVRSSPGRWRRSARAAWPTGR